MWMSGTQCFLSKKPELPLAFCVSMGIIKQKLFMKKQLKNHGTENKAEIKGLGKVG